MHRTLVTITRLGLALLCSGTMAQDGYFPNAVYVVAREGVFSKSNNDKSHLPQLSASPEVADFLAAAGATSIERVFPEFDPEDTLSLDNFGNPVRLVDLSAFYRIEFADSIWWEDLRDAWSGDSSLLIVGQVGYMVPHDAMPNDPLFHHQYHLESLFPEGGYPLISKAWDYTTGSSAVKIGIIDTGFDRDHEDLAPRIAATYRAASGGSDADPATSTEYHGTHVAGTAGAATNNGIGVAGVNWQSPLYLTRAGEHYSIPGIAEGVLFRDDHAGGCIDWLRGRHVNTLNMSFGYTDDNWSEAFKSIFFGNVMAVACYNAWASDILLVGAKGNDNSNHKHRPSDYRTVMGVGSCNLSGMRTPSSNYGSGIDVNTLGEGIYSTKLNDTYGSMSGTSAAAPIATGVISLLKSYRADLTADEIEQIIELTALDVGASGWDQESGWGIVKADSALRFVADNELFRLNATSFSRTQLFDSHEHYFVNEGSPGQDLATGWYYAETWRLVHHFDFPEYNFAEPPSVLIRNRGAQGWSAENPSPMFPYARVVPGTLTRTGCDIETYAFYVRFNLLGQAINEWFPCNGDNCTGNPNVKYQITLAGQPLLYAPDQLVLTSYGIGDVGQQYIRVAFADPNDWEAGWVIERRHADSAGWVVRDTIPENTDDSVVFLDQQFTGSQEYVYRVHPAMYFLKGVASVEGQVTACPHWPGQFTATTLRTNKIAVAGKLSGGVPSTEGVDPIDTSMANQTLGSGPEEPDDGPSVATYPANSIRLTWRPPSDQAVPIAYYRIKRTDMWNDWDPTLYQTTETSLEICDLELGWNYRFRIDAFDVDGRHSSWSELVSTWTGDIDWCPSDPIPLDPGITKVEDGEALITGLNMTYPNPFNATTTIRFSLSAPMHALAEVYNALGQRVSVLVDEDLGAGKHQRSWSGRDESGSPVASGIYFVRFAAGEHSSVTKVMLLK